MRITQFSDYSMRVLIYLGLKGERASVAEISRSFRISRHHLVKVVHRLAQEGFVHSYKGKNGGISLARDPETIRIGDFVQQFEPMDLLECFDPRTNTCPIQGTCRLERSLYEARAAFIAQLNQYCLSDYMKAGKDRTARVRLLGIG